VVEIREVFAGRIGGPALGRAFRAERAETIRTRLRWIMGAAIVVWIVSFVAVDHASFTATRHAAMVRVPECAAALGLWIWLCRMVVCSVTVLALGTLGLRGEVALFMVTMTVVGFAYLTLVASAATSCGAVSSRT
jgi:hypothetical protein